MLLSCHSERHMHRTKPPAVQCRCRGTVIADDGEVIKMSATNFFEAAWVFKRNGTYYFSYSTTPRAQMRIDYMTSSNPTNGFTYRGVVGDQPPINNNNNHAAQFELKGHWYHVYHNRIVAKQAGIPTGFRRNLALEEFSFNEDGTIKKVTCTTNGVTQLGRLDPFTRVEGETFNAQNGVETEPCSEGGMGVRRKQGPAGSCNFQKISSLYVHGLFLLGAFWAGAFFMLAKVLRSNRARAECRSCRAGEDRNRSY